MHIDASSLIRRGCTLSRGNLGRCRLGRRSLGRRSLGRGRLGVPPGRLPPSQDKPFLSGKSSAGFNDWNWGGGVHRVRGEPRETSGPGTWRSPRSQSPHSAPPALRRQTTNTTAGEKGPNQALALAGPRHNLGPRRRGCPGPWRSPRSPQPPRPPSGFTERFSPGCFGRGAHGG